MNIAIEQVLDDSVRVKVSGRLTQEDVMSGGDPLTQLLGPDPFSWRVLLDLSDVEFLDSSGVGWLLRCHKRFRQSGGILVIHSMSAMARNTVKILKLDAMFDIAEDERAAVELIGKGIDG